MNSIVRPIFNIFKCVNSACTVHKQRILSLKSQQMRAKKEEEENIENENADAQTLKPNGYYIHVFRGEVRNFCLGGKVAH